MPKHIPPYNNNNQPIVEENNKTVPLVYYNQVRLNKGEKHSFHLKRHESCVTVASGSIEANVGGEVFENIGKRDSIWTGNPESIYAPLDTPVEFSCISDNCEVFIAGGIAENKLTPFAVRAEETPIIQYGSDETKTHRKIKHILGKNVEGKVDKLLVSELFTVGAGGWSGFPSHKHDEDRLPHETRFEEVYQFRFNPEQGFGAQFGTLEGEEVGDVFHIRNGSTYLIDYGYHPCVAAPGYEMYYFTIIVGASTRSLIQHFHPDHVHQVETIPGIKDMIAGFK